MHDPFRNHTELRDLITPPDASYFRSFTVQGLRDRLRSIGIDADWFYSEEERESRRAAFLADHQGPLWVFAYGSLMWDPALNFKDLRKASVHGHARRFIMLDRNGGRGTADAPGLMAALDLSENATPCEGLVFEIPADQVAQESSILFRREMIGPGYLPRFVTAQTAHGPVEALTFLADHTADMIDGSLTQPTQLGYLRTGAGVLGSSREYLENLAAQLTTLNIHDAEIAQLVEKLAETDPN